MMRAVAGGYTVKCVGVCVLSDATCEACQPLAFTSFGGFVSCVAGWHGFHGTIMEV